MKPAFGVKSARIDALAILLHSDNAGNIRETLQFNIDKYLKFKSLPFILDAGHLDNGDNLPLTDIMAMFAVHGLSIVGLRHHLPHWAKYAEAHGLAFIAGNKADLQELPQTEMPNDPIQAAENPIAQPEIDDGILMNDNAAIKTVEMAKMADLVEMVAEEHSENAFDAIDDTTEDIISDERVSLMPAKPTIVVSTPVRTGQQVYAEQADLIVLGIVSPGAEVIADGNIHIYAPLRGRAIAGASGDTKARIFVQSMQAELVSIAGIYRVFDQKLPPHLHRQAVQIELQDDRLAIGAINAE
ncbi:septum site-determining protein MinC [Alysiella filiformis]|uniref:Probable septum site-determining protein MinC n=1 Tax=Alysiella filiformis DSM 16848 TaxID=1120981 RepID=A0A286EPZ6_9NEIS|nr:septum site-determining protein MinC [Alysiella filiformis]QMT31244.1 septum site-determining protein MinC [Alysiella filiformis]UBQ55755.1 septum site-determining protein MinC [Alysiella filiformis DSM 16848]SOD72879.1 septum site-determining protein MinC [Alysiella filiformis DSM 16848]